MTDTLDTHEKISWDAYRPYALYGNGLRVTDIAVELGQAPGTVYNHMRNFPVEYAKSKHRHIAHRVAKYRRVGALAVDILIDTLEKYKELLDTPEDGLDDEALIALRNAKAEVRARLKDISAIGEAAEKRADLNEGKATERSESSLTVNLPGVVINMPEGLDDEPRAACVDVTVNMPEDDTEIATNE